MNPANLSHQGADLQKKGQKAPAAHEPAHEPEQPYDGMAAWLQQTLGNQALSRLAHPPGGDPAQARSVLQRLVAGPARGQAPASAGPTTGPTTGGLPVPMPLVQRAPEEEEEIQARPLEPLVAEHADGRPRVQRLLMTSAMLTSVAGVPKEDISFGLLGTKKMSTHYKAILSRLDDYHVYLNTTYVDVALPAEQKRDLWELLDAIVAACHTYSEGHEHTDIRYQYIEKLWNEATLEKRNVSQVAANAGSFAGKLWREAIPGHEFGATGGLEVPEDAERITREPGLEATFLRQTSIYEQQTLKGTVTGTAKKNDKAMRTEVPGRTDIVYVELYTESGKTITVAAKGYVPAKDVSKSPYAHEKLPDDQPIFVGVPSIEDIQQRSIGDCYLQAAIASLVSSDPLYVYQMIRDNGDGTVTVRLYNTTADPPEPVYILLQKSLVSGGRRSMGAPWVAFLEKAYAALGPGGNSISYAQLGSGGEVGTALGILTGKVIGGGTASTEGGGAGGTKFWSLPTRMNYEKKYKPRKAKGALLDSDISTFQNSQAFRILQDEIKAMALMDWAIAPANSAMIKRFEAADKVGRIEAFEPILVDFLKDTTLAQDIKSAVEAEIRATYAGIVGSGKYTAYQLQIFAAIKQALDEGRPVGAGTGSAGKKERKSKVTKEGGKGYAGETKGKGIVGGHAYSVIDYAERDPLKFLTLRNPWGSYGSQYVGVDPETGQLLVEGDEEKLNAMKGTFELELTDFTDNYENYAIG